MGAITFDLISLAVGNGSLGSSFEQKTNLTLDPQKKIAYKIYKQSCKNANLKIDDFAKGINLNQATECNDHPLVSGIKFVGGNGNEMYLLSRNYWDVRVLYATYYLLQRGFDGPDPYSLRMDCSAPGFEARPKMTLGVHYIIKKGISAPNDTLNMINSIQDPQPNRKNQYIVNGTNNFTPEGSLNQSKANGISPHAYGQALDVYTFGCTSVYDRLDSDESAAKWACGKTGPVDPASPVGNHSYFYPIKNMPIEIEYADDKYQFSNTFSAPDSSSKPDPHKPYRLDPKPDLTSCSGTPAPIVVQDTCYPFIDPKVITYSNKGCIAQNQPSFDNKYYGSKFFYGLDVPLPAYLGGAESRVQPFQFSQAVFIPDESMCNCISTPVDNSVPETEAADYQRKTGPLNFVNPNMPLTIPPSQGKGLNDDELKTYLQSQAEASRKIVLESSMLFSLRQNNNKYPEAEKYFRELLGNDASLLPKKQMLMNQIVTSKAGKYILNDPLHKGYDALAKLLYGNKGSANGYDFGSVVGHQRGIGYNSTETDRVHLGF